MKLHTFPGYIQTIYLAEYSDKLLLLDGCCRADVEVIERYISHDLKRSMSDLKLIIVTHMHPDHAGAAQLLREHHGTPIATVKKKRHWYHGIRGLCAQLTDLALAYYVVKAHNKEAKNLWYNRKLEPDFALEDEQVLPFFDDWQVLYTPGHTDRDISLYHKTQSKVYVADTILKIKGKYIPPFPVCHPNQYKQSLQRLADLNANEVMMAHGDITKITPDEISHLLDNAPETPRRYGYFIKRFMGFIR